MSTINRSKMANEKRIYTPLFFSVKGALAVSGSKAYLFDKIIIIKMTEREKKKFDKEIDELLEKRLEMLIALG
jgi:hypothetical protein